MQSFAVEHSLGSSAIVHGHMSIAFIQPCKAYASMPRAQAMARLALPRVASMHEASDSHSRPAPTLLHAFSCVQRP